MEGGNGQKIMILNLFFLKINMIFEKKPSKSKKCPKISKQFLVRLLVSIRRAVASLWNCGNNLFDIDLGDFSQTSVGPSLGGDDMVRSGDFGLFYEAEFVKCVVVCAEFV